MSSHLDQASWAELLAGGGSSADRDHLRSCAPCAAELARLREVTAGVRDRFERRARAADPLPLVAEQRIIALMRAQAAGTATAANAVRAAAIGLKTARPGMAAGWWRWVAVAASAAVVVAVLTRWLERPASSAPVATVVDQGLRLDDHRGEPVAAKHGFLGIGAGGEVAGAGAGPAAAAGRIASAESLDAQLLAAVEGAVSRSLVDTMAPLDALARELASNARENPS